MAPARKPGKILLRQPLPDRLYRTLIRFLSFIQALQVLNEPTLCRLPSFWRERTGRSCKLLYLFIHRFWCKERIISCHRTSSSP
jgi:hypothetical protein